MRGDGIDQDCDGADLPTCPEICAEFNATNDQHLKAGRARSIRNELPCDEDTVVYAPKNNYGESMGDSADDVTTLNTTDNGYSYHLGSCR